MFTLATPSSEAKVTDLQKKTDTIKIVFTLATSSSKAKVADLQKKKHYKNSVYLSDPVKRDKGG